MYLGACAPGSTPPEPPRPPAPIPDLGVVDVGPSSPPKMDLGQAQDLGLPPSKPDAGAPEDAGEMIAPDLGPPPEMPPLDDCIPTVQAGAHIFECDGLSYQVSVPLRCETSGCGLIFDVHGFTMSGAMEENNTNLAALTANTDFIVVQPSATPAPPRSNWSARADDDRVFDFMMRAMSVYQTDPARLHITGFSDGGWLTWRFICEHADVLASAAPAAASGYCSIERACDFTAAEQPSVELPILLMLGLQDNYVEIDCAQEQVDAMLQTWNMRLIGVIEEGAGFEITRYESAQGTLFETIVHDYSTDARVPLVPALGGHCYPGSVDAGDEPGQLFSFACQPPNGFHWGERVLEFFQRTAP